MLLQARTFFDYALADSLTSPTNLLHLVGEGKGPSTEIFYQNLTRIVTGQSCRTLFYDSTPTQSFIGIKDHDFFDKNKLVACGFAHADKGGWVVDDWDLHVVVTLTNFLVYDLTQSTEEVVYKFRRVAESAVSEYHPAQEPFNFITADRFIVIYGIMGNLTNFKSEARSYRHDLTTEMFKKLQKEHHKIAAGSSS